MRIAITGASGFVGQHVLRELRQRSLDIVVVARSENGLTAESGSKLVLIDITKCGDDPFERMGRPDVLVHLAWGGLPNYQSAHHVQSELPAHTSFLASCVEGGLKRLVVAGTCFEYGLAEGELQEDAPTQPCTQYGIAKDRLRRMLEKLGQAHDFELAWLRLFYLFGEGQSPKSLYSMFHQAIRSGYEAFDMSGGEQVRDFLPVHEAARLIVDLALTRGDTGVVNICSGAPMTVRQLVQGWIDDTPARIRMNLGRIPYSTIEPMAFWGRRRKLDVLLGGS